MPVKREEAHRALELLEQYHSQLTKPQDRQLRNAIERVIRVFKGRLFQALLDIQEYYELTLLCDTKSTEEKTNESIQVVSRWESNPPILVNARNHANNHEAEEPLPISSQINNSFVNEKLTKTAKSKKNAENKIPKSISQDKLTDNVQVPPLDASLWEYEQIFLERDNSGLGFSIAGGTDNPHIGDDPSIYITKITEGGTAYNNGQLRVNDILVSVNDVSMVQVTHAQSVDILKKTGRNVTLVVKRLNEKSEKYSPINFIKGPKGLGFSIAGGVDSQHIPGDDGIFITKIIEGGSAEQDGRLNIGDRLVSVNGKSMVNITHDEAVAILKSTKQDVNLVVEQQDYSPVKPKPKSSSKKNTEEINGNNKQVRRVLLKKGESGLGFNIVGGEEAEGIFISYIMPGGPADQSGQLYKGDQILSVSGIDMRRATHEQAAAALKGAGDKVDISVQYSIDEFNRFEEKINDLRKQMLNLSSNSLLFQQNYYIRALFDLDVSDQSRSGAFPANAVSIKYGDIFHVLASDDKNWWQVQRIVPEDERACIIPSKLKAEELKLRNLPQKKKKKEKSTDCDSALIPLLCVHG